MEKSEVYTNEILPAGITLACTIYYDQSIKQIMWSPNGEILALSHIMGNLSFFNVENGSHFFLSDFDNKEGYAPDHPCTSPNYSNESNWERHSVTREPRGTINSFSFSSIHNTLSIFTDRGFIEIYDMDKREISSRFNLPLFKDISFHPNGNILAIIKFEGSVDFLNLTTGKIIKYFGTENKSLYDKTVLKEYLSKEKEIIKKTIKSLSSEEILLHFDDLSTNSTELSESYHNLPPHYEESLGILKESPDPSFRAQRLFHKHNFSFDSSGDIFVSQDFNRNIKLFASQNGRMIRTMKSQNIIECLAFDPMGRLVFGTNVGTIEIWDSNKNKLLYVLEGCTAAIRQLTFSTDGQLLCSLDENDKVHIWSYETLKLVYSIENPKNSIEGISLNPKAPFLALHSSNSIIIWKLDLKTVFNQITTQSDHYVNAKVVLIGDTGVGKTGLSLVLNNKTFEATDSTPGRRVWTLNSQEIQIDSKIKQIRETLLWDLAGQPGYRVIHQLHLNEVAVALLVFDARSEVDPLAGIRHWERALRLAEQRQNNSSVPMKKYLVSARNDRGGVSISEDRLHSLLENFGFDGYFKTSAKEGWQINELRSAIEKAIAWEDLPKVSSPQLFAEIKSFLLYTKNNGRLLAPEGELYNEMVQLQHGTQTVGLAYLGQYIKNILSNSSNITTKKTILREHFNTCIGRLENRDLIRRLTFGNYVLLQPELLDAYASAIVIAAKEEPDGFGSIAHEIVHTGRFFIPKEQKVQNYGQEQLLLHATVEELVKYDLALWESAEDGRYLVFPSQFNREYEDAPEPKGMKLDIIFEGPVQSLYSTLVVRLGHSGLFTTKREDMWRNAAIFTTKTGGKCGIYLHEFAEARGRIILFFDEHTNNETRSYFEDFVFEHVKRYSLNGMVELIRFFVCPNCGDPVPNYYVKRLKENGKSKFVCPCGGTVSLVEPVEKINTLSKVFEMNESADQQRNFETIIISAKGETSTNSFQEWAGGERVTLAIVFTDIVDSTFLGENIGDEAMKGVLKAHFDKGNKLITDFRGREIKTTGDGFIIAFKSADVALDFARELHKNTGHSRIKIRAGIHIGAMDVEHNGVFGGTLNFAARVIGAIEEDEIWLSNQAKEDIDRLKSERHQKLQWEKHDDIIMKGFPGNYTLWSVQ